MSDDVRRQVAALIKKWNRWHAPTCCITGCWTEDGRHRIRECAADGTVTQTGWVDCPGLCTCQVEPFVQDLREVLER